MWDAIRGLKDDCNRKYEQTRKYVDEISAEILEPLYEVLKNQSSCQKQVEGTWKNVELEYMEKKVIIEVAKQEYVNAYKHLDDAVDSYDQIKDNTKVSVDKKKKLSQKITHLLQDCKRTERAYMNSVYAVKDARLEYTRALVTKQSFSSNVEFHIGNVSET